MTTVWRDGRRHNAAAAPLHIPVWGWLPHMHTTVGTHSPGLRVHKRDFFRGIGGISWLLLAFLFNFCRFPFELLCFRRVWCCGDFVVRAHRIFNDFSSFFWTKPFFLPLFISLYFTHTTVYRYYIGTHRLYYECIQNTVCMLFFRPDEAYTTTKTLHTHSHAARWARTLSSLCPLFEALRLARAAEKEKI